LACNMGLPYQHWAHAASTPTHSLFGMFNSSTLCSTVVHVPTCTPFKPTTVPCCRKIMFCNSECLFETMQSMSTNWHGHLASISATKLMTVAGSRLYCERALAYA
jgi:hypothetical protein